MGDGRAIEARRAGASVGPKFEARRAESGDGVLGEGADRFVAF